MANKNASRPEVQKHYSLLIRLVDAANSDPFPDRFIVLHEPPAKGAAAFDGVAAFFPYIREALRTLAAHPGGSRPWKSGEFFESSTVELAAPWTGQATFLIGPRVRIDAINGAITRQGNFYDDVFMRAIEGRSVNRLGICPICDKLFIAFRYDQRACSARCGNVLRVRESRCPGAVPGNSLPVAQVQSKREPEDPAELLSCADCGERTKRMDTRHDRGGRRLCQKCFDAWEREAELEAERIAGAVAEKRGASRSSSDEKEKTRPRPHRTGAKRRRRAVGKLKIKRVRKH